VLADPTRGTYNYKDTPPDVVAKVLRIKEVCDRYCVPMKAAALQFVFGHPTVASVVPGTKSPKHQEENMAMMRYPIPASLWNELKEKRLLDEKAPTPK
jgi:D-threo-aldose 1-dehydrogenase